MTNEGRALFVHREGGLVMSWRSSCCWHYCGGRGQNLWTVNDLGWDEKENKRDTNDEVINNDTINVNR